MTTPQPPELRPLLSPCPFCGHETPKISREQGEWLVWCGVGCCDGPARHEELQAIQAWNHRTPEMRKGGG
jgi:hypothetical protein